MAAQGEYQRLEDGEEESPPGEEELLLHVTEGLQGAGGQHPGGPGCGAGAALGGTSGVWGLWPLWSREGGQPGVPRMGRGGPAGPCHSPGSAPAVFLCPADSWHHIKNLDNFFTKISLRGPCLAGAQRCTRRTAGGGGTSTAGARSLTPPNIYHFHQKNGFACMMLSDVFELV